MSDLPSHLDVAVTIVLPTHHRPGLLRLCLDSLLAQTYPHTLLEIIVVASDKDAGFAIVAELATQTDIPMRCVNIPDDPTQGRSPSAKRNYGVTLATGAWVALIDDDCLAHPDWIRVASRHFHDPGIGAIEGEKQIPAIAKPTVTYKGLLSFTRPGGYQTCNMLYRRDIFLQLGGFDLNFPFYLEDSDMAWNVLDAGHAIPHAAGAIVSHPVLPAQPWRMLDDARRAVLLPYLFKKHPARFKQHGVKALRGSHWIYILLYLAIIALLIAQLYMFALVGFLMVGGLLLLHNAKLFRGCAFTLHEIFVTNLLLPIVPVVKLFQLIRGNLKHRVWLWS